MPTNHLRKTLYFRECLHARGELIHYAGGQTHCAVCRSELAAPEFATRAGQPVSVEQVLKDPSASSWLCRALRGALARDPVDAANDAELLAQVLAARCQDILNS